MTLCAAVLKGCVSPPLWRHRTFQVICVDLHVSAAYRVLSSNHPDTGTASRGHTSYPTPPHRCSWNCANKFAGVACSGKVTGACVRADSNAARAISRAARPSSPVLSGGMSVRTQSTM